MVSLARSTYENTTVSILRVGVSLLHHRICEDSKGTKMKIPWWYHGIMAIIFVWTIIFMVVMVGQKIRIVDEVA